MMLVVLIPMFGPLLGGYLTVWFDWRANFALMAVYGVVLWVATWLVLAESNRHPEPSATNFLQLARNARTILSHRTFFAYAMCFAITYTGLFFFLSASPFVLIEVLGVRAQDYGLWFIIVVVGNFVGSFVCARLTRHMPLARVLGIGTMFAAGGGALMLALAAGGVAHPLAVVGPMALYLFGLALINPVCLAAAVAPFPKLAGTASALLGCGQLVVAAVAGQVFMRRFFDGAPVQLAAAVALAGGLILASYLLLIRRVERR
jgi:DHA1 family bicyclomycin/chloramphenicol resistance-like MFS transporter